MLNDILKKKEQLDAACPLPKHTLRTLQEKLFLEWTYNPNVIEGNTLTLNETKVVLEGIDDSNAVVYRAGQVFISDAEHVPPAAILIQENMKDMIIWYRNEGWISTNHY